VQCVIFFHIQAFHSASYVTFEIVNGYSRFYRVEGSTPTSNPFLLCAHLDVVPPGEESHWKREPFDAGIVEENGKVRNKYCLRCDYTSRQFVSW
jgi:acetylornithine deacetylase/succinyl-diaminopimelate desuccinylase-like protein